MKPINSAYPCSTRAQYLLKKTNQHLLDGIVDICTQLREIFTQEEELLTSLISKLKKQDPALKINSEVFLVNHFLIKSIEDDKPDSVLQLLRKIQDIDFNIIDFSIMDLNNNIDHDKTRSLYSNLVKSEIKSIHGDSVEIYNIKNLDKNIEELNIALKNIEITDIDLYEEIKAIITNIYILSSKNLNGGTSYNSLGSFFVNKLRDGQNWTRFFENIIHESAHNYLYLVLQEDPLVLDEENSTYSSPLRENKRPLIGLYQAAFVLSRNIMSIKKAKEHGVIDSISSINPSYNNANNKDTFEDKFLEIYSILEKKKLTKLGKDILQSSHEMAMA